MNKRAMCHEGHTIEYLYPDPAGYYGDYWDEEGRPYLCIICCDRREKRGLKWLERQKEKRLLK